MKKIFLVFFLSICIVFCTTSISFAAQEMDLQDAKLVFLIGDDEAIIWIPATTDAMYNLFVEYTVSNTTLSEIEETSHFAKADKFNLPESFGIEVVAAFGGIKYTPIGYNTITNYTDKQDNVLVDPNWVWDSQIDEEGILLPAYTAVTVRATASFYCEDAGTMVSKTNDLTILGIE